MATLRALLALALLLFAAATQAAPRHPTYESLHRDAIRSGLPVKQFPNFTMIGSPPKYWYFTKPNHPAHPGVIVRFLQQQKNGAWTISENGYSFSSDEKQPQFRAWLAEFTELDRQMREYAYSHFGNRVRKSGEKRISR